MHSPRHLNRGWHTACRVSFWALSDRFSLEGGICAAAHPPRNYNRRARDTCDGSSQRPPGTVSTSPISAGSHATLTVSVSRPASCSITVNYKSGPPHAQGLYTKRTTAGRVSWTWMVGTRTAPGRWGIDVRCGSAGSLHTSFVTR